MKSLPNTCRGQLHLTSAGTPAPGGEQHVDDKGGRLGRQSQLEFEPLRRGLRNRSFPLEPASMTTSAVPFKRCLATTEICIVDSSWF